MNIKYWLLFPLLSWLNIGLAQNYIAYYEYVNEAEYWMYKEKYDHAIKLYLKAFAQEQPTGKDAYLLAKCYALKGNKEACYQWLMKTTNIAVSFTPYLLRRTDQHHVFQAVFQEDGELEALIQDLLLLKEANDKTYKDSIYDMLHDTVAALCKQDQLYRQKGGFANWTAEEYELFEANDSILQHALLNLTQQYGFPGYTHIGTDITDIILVHVNKTRYPIFKKVMLEEVKKGNLLPYGYAEMLDRFEWIYAYNKEKNDCFLYQLYTRKLCHEEDYEAVVERRKNIGLSIYFKGPRKKPFEPYKLLPWVNDQFVKKHSLLNQKK